MRGLLFELFGTEGVTPLLVLLRHFGNDGITNRTVWQ